MIFQLSNYVFAAFPNLFREQINVNYLSWNWGLNEFKHVNIKNLDAFQGYDILDKLYTQKFSYDKRTIFHKFIIVCKNIF